MVDTIVFTFVECWFTTSPVRKFRTTKVGQRASLILPEFGPFAFFTYLCVWIVHTQVSNNQAESVFMYPGLGDDRLPLQTCGRLVVGLFVTVSRQCLHRIGSTLFDHQLFTPSGARGKTYLQ